MILHSNKLVNFFKSNFADDNSSNGNRSKVRQMPLYDISRGKRLQRFKVD